MHEGFSQLLAFMAPCLAITDPLERIDALGRAYIDFGLTHPETYRLIFMEDAKFSDEVLTMNQGKHGAIGGPGDQAFTLLRQTCAQLVESGYAKPIDPDLCAYLLWSTMHGLVSLQLACPSAAYDDPKALTEATIAMLHHGLLK